MPIHFPSTDRRHFLTIAGSGVVLNASKGLASDAPNGPASAKRQPKRIDDELVVILNDTHIGEKHPPDSAVPSNLRSIVNSLTDQTHRPSCVIINGDLALKDVWQRARVAAVHCGCVCGIVQTDLGSVAHPDW